MTMRYQTVRGEASAEYEISRSRFIAYVRRAASGEEAASFLQAVKKNIGTPAITARLMSSVSGDNCKRPTTTASQAARRANRFSKSSRKITFPIR